jgi:hypothetical protein
MAGNFLHIIGSINPYYKWRTAFEYTKDLLATSTRARECRGRGTEREGGERIVANGVLIPGAHNRLWVIYPDLAR